MKIPIIADMNKMLAAQFGVLLQDGSDAGIPLRGIFIISPTGVVRQSTINDLPVGRNVDETIRLIKAFQFTEAHGEVCPANWQPGGKTMKGDPTLAQEYFGGKLQLFITSYDFIFRNQLLYTHYQMFLNEVFGV